MSMEKRISISIPETEINEINDLVRRLSGLLNPYLQGLSEEERVSYSKMKDKSRAFVEKADAYSKSNPEFLPQFMDPKELHKDPVFQMPTQGFVILFPDAKIF